MPGKDKYFILVSDKSNKASDQLGFIPNPNKDSVQVLAIFHKMNRIEQSSENPNPSLRLEDGFANDDTLLDWSLNSSKEKSKTMNLQLIEMTEESSKIISLRNCIKASPVKLVTKQHNPERKIDELIIACEKTAVISSFQESIGGRDTAEIKTTVEYTDSVIEAPPAEAIKESPTPEPAMENSQPPKPIVSKPKKNRSGFKSESWFFDCPEGAIATLEPVQYNIFCYGMSACFALFFYMMCVILLMAGS